MLMLFSDTIANKLTVRAASPGTDGPPTLHQGVHVQALPSLVPRPPHSFCCLQYEKAIGSSLLFTWWGEGRDL